MLCDWVDAQIYLDALRLLSCLVGSREQRFNVIAAQTLSIQFLIPITRSDVLDEL